MSIFYSFLDTASYLSKFVNFDLHHLHLTPTLGIGLPYVRVSPDTSSFWASVRASRWFFINPQFVRVFILQLPLLTFFEVLVGPASPIMPSVEDFRVSTPSLVFLLVRHAYVSKIFRPLRTLIVVPGADFETRFSESPFRVSLPFNVVQSATDNFWVLYLA